MLIVGEFPFSFKYELSHFFLLYCLFLRAKIYLAFTFISNAFLNICLTET